MAVHVRHNNVPLRVHGYVTRIIQLSVTIAKWTKLERLTCNNDREQYVIRCCKVKSSTLTSQKNGQMHEVHEAGKSAEKNARTSHVGFVLPWLAKKVARHFLTNDMAGQGNITVKLRLIDGLLAIDSSTFFNFQLLTGSSKRKSVNRAGKNVLTLQRLSLKVICWKLTKV